jgi:uncharacterized alkaline shock family protein YloU
MMVGPWQRLPCGRATDGLVTYAAEGIGAPAGSHEAGCEYCQTAIDEFGRLWLPVRRWAQREVDLPDDFVATVIARVRRIVQSPRHVVSVSSRGATTVTSWVLGLIAASAARQVPGVAAITPSRAGRQPAARFGAEGAHVHEVDDASISVGLTLVARTDQSLPDLADAVRRKVMSSIADQAGVNVGSVDIVVDDLDVPDST